MAIKRNRPEKIWAECGVRSERKLSSPIHLIVVVTVVIPPLVPLSKLMFLWLKIKLSKAVARSRLSLALIHHEMVTTIQGEIVAVEMRLESRSHRV